MQIQDALTHYLVVDIRVLREASNWVITEYFIDFIIYFIALLSVIILFARQRSKEAGILIGMMVIILGSEWMGYKQIGQPLTRMNLTVFFEFLAHMMLYFWLITWKPGRLLLGLFMGVYVLFWLISSNWLQPMDSAIQSYPYLVGASFLLISALVYFYQELVVQQQKVVLYRNFYCWISAGLFIWLATEIPFMASLNYVIREGLTLLDLPMLNMKIYASMLYYCCYPIGLLWTIRN